jgi:DNA-binding protein HU-beta
MATSKKKAVNKGNNGLLAAEIGAGVLAAGAAGAAYYFYGTKKAKKHRAAASKWAKDMKKEVLKEAKKVQKLDRQAMGRIVDAAAASYKSVKSVKPEDLAHLQAELKHNWEVVARELAPAKAPSKKAVKKAVKKVMKKVAPKKAAKKVAKAAPKKKAAKKR